MKKIAVFLSLAIYMVFISGCAGTASVIKDVGDKQVDNLKKPELAKPIQFTKIVVKLKRGEHIGAMQGGLMCISQGDINWKGGRVTVDTDDFTDTFKEELEKYDFKTVGDTNALFEDPSSWKSEILVAGLVKELKANICYPYAGFGNFSSSKGEAFIKVDWQIYSKLDRSVVLAVTTEGSSKKTEAISGGDNIAVLNAFSQATRNLLANEKFRDIVSKGGETVKESISPSTDSIVVSNSKSKVIGKDPKKWSSAVVTVFAGNGHGSGFAISDDLILTNNHVVGSSNSVRIRLDSDIEIIGKVIASNSSRDVAVIKLDATLPSHFNVRKELPNIGEDVYALGSPLEESLKSTLSKGIVSAFREENKLNYIQSDVNVNPGNSGGPLIDKNGNVVGITVSGYSINKAPQGINFFIPINEALSTLNLKL
jgi:serine protease Do